MTAYLTKSNDYGVIQFWLNGLKIGDPIDLFDPKPDGTRFHAAQFGETDLGFIEIIDGVNELKVEVVGKNPDSSGHHVGIDFFDFWPVGFVPGE